MCVLQALTDPPGVAQTDVPGLQLAIAVIASLYILRDKKRIGLGKTLRCLAQHLKHGMAVIVWCKFHGKPHSIWLRLSVQIRFPFDSALWVL